MKDTASLQSTKQNGFGCPVCNHFIPTSVLELVSQSVVICPTCGLNLAIEKENSRKAMEILKKVVEGQKEIDRL